MVTNDRLSSAIPAALGSDRSDSLRRVRHDLRHALYVSDLALSLLADSRMDANRFAEVLQMIRKEQATMQSLVDDLLLMASADGAIASNVETTGGRGASSLASRRA